MSAGGCGYAIVQTGPVFGAQEIAVVPFVEDEPVGIAGDLATALAERLAAAGITLTPSRDRAGAVLSGRIVAVGTSTAPISDPTLPITIYRVNLVVLATLTRGKQELWHTQVVLNDDFLPNLNNTEPAADLGTEANRRESLLRIIRSLAQSLTDQLRIAAAVTPEKRS